MNIVPFSLFCLISMCFGKGHGILCYHCHQTSKECNNGVVDAIRTKNCSEDRCAVMKYETPMPGKLVLATFRDCASYTEREFVQIVSPDMRNPAKIVLFHECSGQLCNGVNKVPFISNIFVIAVLISVYLLR